LLKNNKCEASETFTEMINSLEVNQNQKKLLNTIRDNLNESFKNIYLSSCLKVRILLNRLFEWFKIENFFI